MARCIACDRVDRVDVYATINLVDSFLLFACTDFYPLLIILKKLKRCRQPVQFHDVSTYIKVVMFTGILSMAVIGFHH